jgi:hypothetical protein
MTINLINTVSCSGYTEEKPIALVLEPIDLVLQIVAFVRDYGFQVGNSLPQFIHFPLQFFNFAILVVLLLAVVILDEYHGKDAYDYHKHQTD